MKTDMQGLTIAIFRQKLNFFSEKFLVFWGVLKILVFENITFIRIINFFYVPYVFVRCFCFL